MELICLESTKKGEIKDFLHRLTTLDTRTDQTEGFLLSAQGKIRAFFSVMAWSDLKVELLSHPHWSLAPLLESLKFQESITLTSTPIQHEEDNFTRIAAHKPGIQEMIHAANPLEIDCFIPEHKGCYPGQEVIERIRSGGSPARRLISISGIEPMPQPGDPYLSNGEKIGTVTSSCQKNGDWIGLALVRKTHLQ